ncbi:MAG: sensor histidine kinase, partial [Candidatus Coproplasma sp.]
PDALLAATVVTIHYEAGSIKEAGIEGIPLIGSDEAVRNAVARDNTLSIILFVLAALISAIFVFVCFLKKTVSFLPHLGIVFGIFGIVFSSYVLTVATSFPYFWKFVRTLMCALTMLSAFYALRNKKTPFKVWIVFAVLSHVLCLSVPLLQILPFDVSAWSGFYSLVVTLICSCAIVISVFVYAKQKEGDVIYLINSLLAGIMGISLCLPDGNLFAAFNPALWMCAIIIAYTAFLGLCVFIRQEKRLNYLTKNLQSEVQIRTKEMKTMLEERDELLRYVSHDMKKPAASIEHYLGILRQREQDRELCKTIDILSKKVNELNRNFAELSSYAKNSFAAEESRIFDLNELLVRTHEDFEPDCTANGICLKTIACKIAVYAQYNNLYSVIGNVILNAIEHSECKNILIAATKKKGVCILSIADDGKGIDESKDVFMPYYSETVSENNTGIGLYISRNFMRSMNGELTYRQEDGKLEFLITLPLA